MTLELVNESGGFAPTRKYHLAGDSRSDALCGARPSSLVWNVSVPDRAEFERLCPERICTRCSSKEAKMATAKTYESQSARDAQSKGYGSERFWDYLEQAAHEHRDYFLAHGEPEVAHEMMTQTLSEALRGNDGI